MWSTVDVTLRADDERVRLTWVLVTGVRLAARDAEVGRARARSTGGSSSDPTGAACHDDSGDDDDAARRRSLHCLFTLLRRSAGSLVALVHIPAGRTRTRGSASPVRGAGLRIPPASAPTSTWRRPPGAAVRRRRRPEGAAAAAGRSASATPTTSFSRPRSPRQAALAAPSATDQARRPALVVSTSRNSLPKSPVIRASQQVRGPSRGGGRRGGAPSTEDASGVRGAHRAAAGEAVARRAPLVASRRCPSTQRQIHASLRTPRRRSPSCGSSASSRMRASPRPISLHTDGLGTLGTLTASNTARTFLRPSHYSRYAHAIDPAAAPRRRRRLEAAAPSRRRASPTLSARR